MTARKSFANSTARTLDSLYAHVYILYMTTYEVTYTTASGATRTVRVEAIDAVDAKHLAEFKEGEVIVTAKARKVR